MIVTVRVQRLGGHDHLTFWTGEVGYTLANIGTLTLGMDDTDEFLNMMNLSQRTGLIVKDQRPNSAWSAALEVRRSS